MGDALIPKTPAPEPPPAGHGVAAAESPAVLSRDLLERVRAREPDALARFFDHYFDRIYGVVYRLLGDRDTAQDVTQDVFLKAHRGIDRLDVSRDPGPWLHAIAANACRDLWRSSAWRLSRRSAPADEGSIVSGLSDPRGTPEEAVLQAERERVVQAAIAELPEPLRLAVVLHDFGGLDQLQVAELTGVNHAAARKRYSRALRMLGERLTGLWAP